MSEVEDRISNLPASLVHHILSFVDTRDAARTSVLSRRWKHIWRSIPYLKFLCDRSSRVQKFMQSVDKTLELHDDSNIQKFYLFSEVLLANSKIKKWVSTLIKHKVEELTLCFHQRETVLMPPSLCTCESLIDLTLASSRKISFPTYNISFPRLKSLVLFRVEFRDSCWNEHLFSNCPVLELLSMNSCTWSDMKNFWVSNPALKHLSILNMEDEDGFRNCALKINAPSLESLMCSGMVAKDYTLSSFPALVKAYIAFSFQQYGAIIDYGAVVSKFLRATAHVVNLNISDRTLQVLSVPDDLSNHLPLYHNLNHLCLAWKVIADKALIALLEKAPNLVSFRLEKIVFDNNDDASDDDVSEGNHYNDAAEAENDGWALDTVAARCSFLHLKVVSFDKFTGDAKEMKWLKLILNNAVALETMTISISCERISIMKRKNLMADISGLPRASASCVFKFILTGFEVEGHLGW